MTQQTTEKTFKLPKEVREYHKQKARQKRGWKCATCGGEPILKVLETGEKFCLKDFIAWVKQKKEKPE
jgi:hypothetical protein